jgi:hypothetical protein
VTDPFSSARLLIRGAYEDIDRLDAAFDAFFKSEPYAKVVETDPHGAVDFHKVKMTKKLPALLSRDVARVGNELRSALDQAGYAMAAASGKARLKYTYFPFGASTAHLEDVIRGRCKDLPKEIATLFRSFNPYRGGDDLLWAINEIANGIKHRFIVPVGQGVGKAILEHFRADQLIHGAFPPLWDSANDEMVFCVVRHGSDVSYDYNLGFFVAFGNIDVVRGMHVTPTLKSMAAKVDSIIAATEIEARRIGLIT